MNWRVSNPESGKYSQRDSYGLSQYRLRAGSFSKDTRGHWHLNVRIQVETQEHTGTAAVGIDLGLKTAAATSDGEVLIGRQYRALEQKLGIAQRTGKKARVRALHAKIKNQKKDAQHKFST